MVSCNHAPADSHVPIAGRSDVPALDRITARVRSRLTIAASVGAAILLVTACSPSEPANGGDAAATPARRIVALTVGSVDTLALLGQLDRVVAVEEDCHVPGTEHLVKIRNDDHSGPSRALNVEAVLALDPDLVIAKEELKPALGDRGLKIEWIPSSFGLEDVAPFVERLGARLGVPDRARDVVAAMRAKRSAIEARVASEPRVRVYFEAGKPGRTVGRGTVVDDMIRLAGGDNIAGDGIIANPMLSAEAILLANPEVIVLSPWSDTPDEIAQRPGWSRIDAVKNGRVHRVAEAERKFQYPSPSCVVGCEQLLVPWFHPSLPAASTK